MNLNFPLEINALMVSQKIGFFYVIVLPASILQKITFSYPAQFSEEILTGTQRKLKEDRLEQISKYAATAKATFPNAIILGANYNTNGDFVEDESIRWSVCDSGNTLKMLIPTDQPIASIIDGQHRLEGIKKYLASEPEAEDVDLVCTVFMDMASPFQAEIFATINYTQQQVDKSLAYQLFGYRLDEAKSYEWAPETLAVYLSRVMNNDANSPFYNRIKSGLYEEGDQALLRQSDIIDKVLFLKRLAGNGAECFKRIYARLDDNCKNILNDIYLPDEFKVERMIQCLNKIIQKETLWSSNLFDNIKLSEETNLLIELNSKKYQTRLNRRILEDVFSGIISKATLPEVGLWVVSTASIVEGITKLFSSKPIEDRYRMHKKGWFGKGRSLLKNYPDKAPLRSMFIENNDKGIYQIIVNYFKAVEEVLWANSDNDFIIKTIGILASFDVLRHILIHGSDTKYTKDYFVNIIDKAKLIDFSDNYFHASGSGRSRVKNSLLLSLNLDTDSHKKSIAGIKSKYIDEFNRLSSSPS